MYIVQKFVKIYNTKAKLLCVKCVFKMESSEEIVDTENSNQLLQADKDILMSILPSNVS